MSDDGPQTTENEVSRLRARLQEAEETLRALRAGDVDAIVVNREEGASVYTLKSAVEPYQKFVEQMSEGAVTLSPDGIILFCNAAFARIMGIQREQLTGRNFSEFIVGKTTSGSTNILDMVESRFAIQLKTEVGSLADVHVSSTPLVLDDDLVHCLVVTDLSRQGLRLMHDAIVTASADAILSLNITGIIETWNPAATRLFGYSAADAIGRSFGILRPAKHPGELDKLLARVMNGELIHQEMTLQSNNGTIETLVSAAPLIFGRKIEGVAVIAKDISERKRHEDHIRALMREINHRSKNLLSVVQGIAARTAETSPRGEFLTNLSERLSSLAASQDLLVSKAWRGVALCDLVKAQLSGFIDMSGARIALCGPYLELKPSATQAIGMALHELATNAVKYGALSSEEGMITIEWGTTASADDGFWMKWIENGGPEVTPPASQGFGHNVIVKLVESSVHGRATVVYDKQGLRWELRAPIKDVIESEDDSTFPDSNPGAL